MVCADVVPLSNCPLTHSLTVVQQIKNK